MAKWSDRTTYQGKAVNVGTKALLAAANVILRSDDFGGETEDVTMVQGGYNKGGVKASAGTHDGGGAFDLTPHNWRNRVKVLRILGTTASHRPYLKGYWGEHIHAIVCGDGTASDGGLDQVEDYYKDRNGLANNGRDTDWRPKVLPILFHLPTGTDLAVRYAKDDTTMYDQPSTKGTERGTLKKGAKFTTAAMVKVGTAYWIVNVEGRCVPDAKLTKTKPKATAKPTPAPPVVVPPVCAVPAPTPKPAPPITLMTWNLKSPTLLGKWLTWPLRRGGQVKIIAAAKPTVFLAQEVGPPSKERWYNGALAPRLANVNAHNREGSGMWRAIWFDPKVFTRVTSGLYTLPSMLAKDDKQMAECILKDRAGEPYYFGSLHLENEDATGRTQVEQIEDCFNHAIKMRDLHGVKPERMFLGGDANSRNLVRQWVEEHTDYYDAAGRAKSAKHTDIKSISDWLPFRKGAREDYIFVHKNVVVESFDQVDGHKVSDHNPQIIVTK